MIEMDIKQAFKIIKAAKKLGVISMKIGTLEFELDPAQSRPALKVSEKKIRASDEKNELQMKFNTSKEDLSVMHVEDPSGFEAALIEKELDDIDGGEHIEETFDQ